MFVLLLLSLIISLFLVAGSFYYLINNEFNGITLMAIIVGLIFNLAAIFCGVEFGKNVGRVNGLLESGKYEIATHDDYSINELETFLKIDGVYLKCTEN